jgi:ElaB/YqjD/DUF883 family membrane-anchored ribosome-binding protein
MPSTFRTRQAAVPDTLPLNQENTMATNTPRTANEGPHGRIERAAERAKEATSDMVDSTRDKMDAAADRVEEGFHHAADTGARTAHRSADKIGELRKRGAELASDAGDRADLLLDRIREFARDKPVQSLAMTLAAGWLLGRLLKPRR